MTLWKCQTYFHLLMVPIGFNSNFKFPLQFVREEGLPLISVTLQMVKINSAEIVN